MSRIANVPVAIPKGVETSLSDSKISVKGSKGNLNLALHNLVAVAQDGEELKVSARNTSREAGAMAGTFRSLINNMFLGVTEGFQKKLELQGVGYRAKAGGKSVNLTVGYSHPIDYKLPDGVTAETPSQTEIVISGADKQLVGQVAAEIRKFRPPEPYKGKGIRYADERVFRKEAKKK
ncbi:50S ribosomal protein L6 [Gammaproteobacteria bacterium]|jgi:large subunit ribosomal protein L6|nr:50S ribosomal protein L6 [Gammaproteobacteria bacterium]MDC0220200.1 50S ribosomal protein L6 [Gammaproteobacteria bacterium]|tara:strand:+ start:533 stop:1066 length:534 start_codon:yes stop_codon:yes gene_type:complete